MALPITCTASTEKISSTATAVPWSSPNWHVAVRFAATDCIRLKTAQTLEVTVTVVPAIKETNEGIAETTEGGGPSMTVPAR